MSGAVCRAFQGLAPKDLLAGLGVLGVASLIGRGGSVFRVLAQYPGGGALWFVPFIRCKNASAGQNQRGRVLCVLR